MLLFKYFFLFYFFLFYDYFYYIVDEEFIIFFVLFIWIVFFSIFYIENVKIFFKESLNDLMAEYFFFNNKRNFYLAIIRDQYFDFIKLNESLNDNITFLTIKINKVINNKILNLYLKSIYWKIEFFNLYKKYIKNFFLVSKIVSMTIFYKLFFLINYIRNRLFSFFFFFSLKVKEVFLSRLGIKPGSMKISRNLTFLQKMIILIYMKKWFFKFFNSIFIFKNILKLKIDKSNNLYTKMKLHKKKKLIKIFKILRIFINSKIYIFRKRLRNHKRRGFKYIPF
jgi:hypothetical protein